MYNCSRCSNKGPQQKEDEMGFVVQVYKRKMPEGTPGVDPAVQLLQKYELHRNGEVFAAGMETIQEVIDEISETCRNRYDSDEVTISSLEPKDVHNARYILDSMRP